MLVIVGVDTTVSDAFEKEVICVGLCMNIVGLFEAYICILICSMFMAAC